MPWFRNKQQTTTETNNLDLCMNINIYIYAYICALVPPKHHLLFFFGWVTSSPFLLRKDVWSSKKELPLPLMLKLVVQRLPGPKCLLVSSQGFGGYRPKAAWFSFKRRWDSGHVLWISWVWLASGKCQHAVSWNDIQDVNFVNLLGL